MPHNPALSSSFPNEKSCKLTVTVSENKSDSDTTTLGAADHDEDKYTLTAYGDLSLSETSPPDSYIDPLSKRAPSLRLKVRRPPMPRRKSSVKFEQTVEKSTAQGSVASSDQSALDFFAFLQKSRKTREDGSILPSKLMLSSPGEDSAVRSSRRMVPRRPPLPLTWNE